MSPYLARSFSNLLNYSLLYLFLFSINDIPLFYAAKTNNVECIKKLGALGETALHIAAMNDNLEAALALMDGAPELINEPMTSELFQGITPLHIAVENQNISLVHHLISRGGDVETPRATGLYFRKRRGGLIYYGEHVLSFAVCTGNKDIISMIIDAGASTRVQDYRGNTVLHVLVLQPNKVAACQTIDLIMAHNAELHEEVPLDMVRNIRGLTPFKLAAKEGNTVVFQHLINKRRICQWSLGSLSSNLYDLTEIDSRADNMSVLELIVSSHNKEVRRLLEVTPVKQLVSLKWNLYGKHYFRLLILLYLLHIGIFTVCCLFRPLKDIPQNYTQSPMDKTIMIEKSLRESYVTHEDNLRLAGEIISLLGAFIILFIEIPDIVKVGAKRFFGHTAMGGPFHVILISYASLVVLLFVFRLCNVPGEIDVMALCLVFCWCNATFFSRGFEMLSSHSIMIQKIILEDLGKFMWQMLIIIIAFSTVYMTQDPTSIPPYASFALTLFYETELISGFVNLPFDPTIYTPPIVCVMHVVFASVVCILLVNLLIAMLTDTEWKVAKQKDLLWKFQMVAIILMVERRLPRCLWPRFGVCGLKYGLKERWYLRNHRIMQEGKRYKEDVKKRDGLDKTAQKETVSRIPDLKPKNSFGKTAKGWSLSHHSTLDMEMELKGLEEDIKYV
uniref:Transient receptor potential cation channel, subfamily V, member 6 n=1 Tax=Mastacembelus armatus TaxID=205130 RepID=A0A7N9ASD4_9TELE